MSKQLGFIGERIALNYLEKLGYSVIATNYRTKYGEIDIICLDNKTLVFVEVKTRKSVIHGEPFEAVNASKIHRIGILGQIFILERKLGHMVMRIDVISIWITNNKRVQIKHIKDITSL
jgi:putative endonuclease